MWYDYVSFGVSILGGVSSFSVLIVSFIVSPHFDNLDVFHVVPSLVVTDKCSFYFIISPHSILTFGEVLPEVL